MPDIRRNTRLKMEGREFLTELLISGEKYAEGGTFPAAFFDPQYRGGLDRLAYGNEGKNRGQARAALPQMDDDTIAEFIRMINAVLWPSGHLFLWLDKFHLCEGIKPWLDRTELSMVDLVVWDKDRMGMGYRTRSQAEFLMVLQKKPLRAKGVWMARAIANVWRAKADRTGHPHAKPVGLQRELIKAVVPHRCTVIDPAAGSFSVMEAAQACERDFLGCDIAETADV